MKTCHVQMQGLCSTSQFSWLRFPTSKLSQIHIFICISFSTLHVFTQGKQRRHGPLLLPPPHPIPTRLAPPPLSSRPPLHLQPHHLPPQTPLHLLLQTTQEPSPLWLLGLHRRLHRRHRKKPCLPTSTEGSPPHPPWSQPR